MFIDFRRFYATNQPNNATDTCKTLKILKTQTYECSIDSLAYWDNKTNATIVIELDVDHETYDDYFTDRQ
ncbi:hypothetical protein MOMA_08481 [Moraxella macacae 0408225]|uniref:Uncharacterized protein n=1 Tax=Moraxella macacae 0408225 TaxID=1230338 RepID=L2F6B4_9GAMM|nr:hypothetical protein [Moraxella macacae]ELA08584.1 hypothetical protein MOMA_08481 [Moraxella macacae 0408225]